METHSTFDLPLESLTRGEHAYSYVLDDAFFAAFDSDLLRGGDFAVALEAERIRNQFNLRWTARGAANVMCDRCLAPFALPLEVEDEIVVKFDSDNPRVEEDVIYVPYGTERFNVAKLLYDSIGLTVPMSKVHDAAGLECDPEMTKYLSDGAPEGSDAGATPNDEPIPEDSPWSVLRDLGTQEN